MLFTPAVEYMTVGVKDIKVVKPNYRYIFAVLISSRQPDTKLAYQSRWNVVQVQSIKRGGYRVPGSDKVHFSLRYFFLQIVNPNEKPAMANGWVVATWTEQGIHLCFITPSR